MLKGKAKRYLRSLAVLETPILQIGKGNITPNIIKQLDDALAARELVKIRVLNTHEISAKELAPMLSETTNSVLVQVIGHNIVLYRRSLEKPKIELPN